MKNTKASSNDLTNMSLIKMFIIRDTEAQICHTPFFNRSTTVAKRMVASTVNNPESLIHDYPNQFQLHLIGYYDDTTGNVTLIEGDTLICQLDSLKKDVPK